MCLLKRLLETFYRDVSVDLGGAQRSMTQDFLHGSEISPVV
jgi:hypothetical protein